MKVFKFFKYLILTFIICFFIFCGLLYKFNYLLNIPLYVFKILFFVSIGIGILVAVLFSNRTKRTGRIIIFIDNHLLDFILIFLSFCGLLFALHDGTRLRKDEALTVLGICWAIFAITILILTLSMPLISKILELKITEITEQNNLKSNIKETQSAYKKMLNSRKAIYGSFHVTLVLINLVVLIVASCYCTLFDYSVFIENLLFICVLCTLFTILEIFLLYTYDIYANKKEILKANKLSKKDIKLLNKREEILTFCSKFKKLDEEIPLKSRNVEYKKLNKLFRNLSEHINNLGEKNYIDDHFLELDNLVSRIKKLLIEYKIKL